MTADLAKSIQSTLTASLGDAARLRSVHLTEGWGDVFYVTVRLSSPELGDRDELSDRIKSAVHSALGEIRYLVKIEWQNPVLHV